MPLMSSLGPFSLLLSLPLGSRYSKSCMYSCSLTLAANADFYLVAHISRPVAFFQLEGPSLVAKLSRRAVTGALTADPC